MLNGMLHLFKGSIKYCFIHKFWFCWLVLVFNLHFFRSKFSISFSILFRFYGRLFYVVLKQMLRSSCLKKLNILWCVRYQSDNDIYMMISCRRERNFCWNFCFSNNPSSEDMQKFYTLCSLNLSWNFF